MKFYDEKQMIEIRKALENDIMQWPGVTSREMMGCLCYFRGKKFFAWLVTDGIVLPKLAEDDRRKLQDQFNTQPFEMGSKTTKLRKVILKKPEDLQPIKTYIRKSYDAAIAE
jgi:hypothetical protein